MQGPRILHRSCAGWPGCRDLRALVCGCAEADALRELGRRQRRSKPRAHGGRAKGYRRVTPRCIRPGGWRRDRHELHLKFGRSPDAGSHSRRLQARRRRKPLRGAGAIREGLRERPSATEGAPAQHSHAGLDPCGKERPDRAPTNGQFLKDRLPRSRLTLLEGGHLVWEDAAEEYADHVASWLGGAYHFL
jgi:pimeloyl-ACP methyl ester carboxylesterase